MKFISGFFLITFAVSLAVTADIFLKKSEFHDWRFISIGFLLYGLEAIPTALAFQKINFGPIFIIWSALSVILGLIVASLIFKETVSSYKVLALGFAVFAIILSNK